ncbi:MAG: histidinol-phosphate transaminase [Armatimonadetes bacterium]|nr:histidinol-phosphate transaminase [Armatimonadota bacterium]
MFSIRKNVLKMRPYSPGKPIDEVKRELGLSEVVKLASNENPYGPSPKALQAMQEALPHLNLYPDASQFDLKAAISRKFDIPSEHLIVSNGSDQIIHWLGEIFLGSPIDEVVTSTPSFQKYDGTALLADCVLKTIPLDAEHRHDIGGLINAITENTKLVFIANPNNPTGTIMKRQELDALIGRLPKGAAVVLDEAYHEFADFDADYPNGLDYVKAGMPVITLRTFSKAYGLAGIRLGYAFAPTEMVEALNRIREPFIVNNLALVGGIAALSDDEHLKRTVQGNAAERARLTEFLKEQGLQVIPSHANFVMVDLGQPSQPVFDALLREGYVTRPGTVLGMPNFMRISVGTADEMTGFFQAFARVLEQTKVHA